MVNSRGFCNTSRVALFVDLPAGYDALALRTPTLPPVAHTNCYVIGHRQAIVVDPGSPYAPEQARLLERLHRLRGSGGALQAILLTHHHKDHVGGALALATALQVPVAAHPETFARLAELGRAPCAPRELFDGSVLEVDGRSIEVLHTPGHAPGHLCLFERASGALLAGDMVPGIGTTLIDPSEGDMGDYLTQLERLAALEPRLVLPSHGPVKRDGAAWIRKLIQHRLMREAKVRAALGAHGQALETVARLAYPEVPPFLGPLAVRSALAHLIKLEREGHARRTARGEWQAPAVPSPAG